MHDLRTTCADRDTKIDHLGILKELSSSKTRNFERDRSFSSDLFLYGKKEKKKNQGYCIYAKQKGRDVVLYIIWTCHVIGCIKGRAS